MSEPEKTSIRLKVDDVGKIPSMVELHLKGRNPSDLVLLQLDSEKFPRRILDFPEDVRKYIMTHPKVKVEWKTDHEFPINGESLITKTQQKKTRMAYLFSNAESLSKLKTLKDEFTRGFKVHEDDVVVFMNLAFPYFNELDFFRNLKCKKYIVHRAGYYRKDLKFNKYFGLEELKTEEQFFDGRFGIHYECGMKPRLTDLNLNQDVSCVDWSFLEKYPHQHTPTTGFIVYFLVKQFFPNHQIRLLNFDGKESNQKFGHKWSFEIKYFNDVDIGHKIDLLENTNSIDVCFITDKSYVELTQMAIFSAIKSKNQNTILNVHVICDKVSNAAMRELEQLSCKNVIVKTYAVDTDEYVKDAPSYRYCSKTMYLKMFIPSILKELDKVLYLDSDVIVRKDLTEYFNQLNINESCDMAVIKDLGLIKIWKPTFKVYEVDDVFYSGQMLMNLKNLRGENGIDRRFINILNSGKIDISYGDEQVFNILEFNRVKYLDIKYCLSWHKIAMNSHPEVYANIDVYNQVYGTEYKSMDELIGQSVIWHFHGDKKKIFEYSKVKPIIDKVKLELNDFKKSKM